MKICGVELTREGIKAALARLNVWMAGEPIEDSGCKRAPPGWFCTRMRDHPGPCAAWPLEEVAPCRHDIIGQCPFCSRDKADPELVQR